MESISSRRFPNPNKRKKPNQYHNPEITETDGLDPTTKLPEALVIHILSFLPPQDAVRTSILSSRWRNLFPYIQSHNLDFHSQFASNGGMPGFVKFTNQWIHLNRPPGLYKFKLRLDFKRKYSSDIEKWVLFALRKEVQELELEFVSRRHRYELPWVLFDSDSLKVLKLVSCVFELPSGFKGFRLLKKLSLSDIELKDDLVKRLIVGCPLIEDLELVKCWGISHLCVNLGELKRLRVQDCCITNGLQILAPNLMSLSISENEVMETAEYCLKDLKSLDYAYVDLKFGFEWDSDDFRGTHLILDMLLEDLGHARTLQLGSNCIQVLSIWEFRNRRPPLSKHKCLVLETGLKKWELPGIASLLRSLPDLEALVIEVVPTFQPRNFDEEFMQRFDFDKRQHWESQKSLFPCLQHHLKTVKILDFMGGGLGSSLDSSIVRRYLNKQEKKIKLVKFLLKNSLVLEKMTIHIFEKPHFVKVEEWPQLLLEVTQKMLALPRASSQAEVLFLCK